MLLVMMYQTLPRDIACNIALVLAQRQFSDSLTGQNVLFLIFKTTLLLVLPTKINSAYGRVINPYPSQYIFTDDFFG